MSNYPESFYEHAALLVIKGRKYYGNVVKCGLYHGKRAYQPIFKPEYRLSPPKIGVAPVILVDDEGNAECVNFLKFGIYDEIRRNNKCPSKRSAEEI